MRKLLVLCILCLVLSTGCVMGTSPNDKQPDIKVEDLDYDIENWVDSYDNSITYSLTYENNTDYVLTEFGIVATEQDQELDNYLTNESILKPGEKSKKATQQLDSKPDELDVKEIRYNYIDKDGQEWSVIYDVRFGTYQTLQVTRGVSE